MPFLPSLGRKGGGAGRLETQELPADVPPGVARELKEIILMRPGDTVLPAGRSYGGAWTMQRAIKQAYERVSWIYKAVDCLASNSSAVPLGRAKYRGPGQELGAVTYDFPLAELLNGRANPVEHGPIMRKRLAAQVCLSPRGAFVELQMSRAQRVAELRLLPPGQTRPIPGKDGNIDHYQLENLAQTEKVEVPAERVRWFRNPHPDDPWRSMTPLEAAGLTVELDYFARLSARSFAINDGRPGIVIGVKGDLTDTEMDRIEQKFSGGGGGPTNAGRTTVIAADDMAAVDMSTTPREADYGQTRLAGRDEILAVFGTPLSVLGDASGRTFDNADAELWNFWTITMPPFLGLLEYPWYEDVGAGHVAFHDLTRVEALQRAARMREDRLASLVAQGLITVDEFREGTGRDPFGRPSSRALWIPGGRLAIAANEEDMAWLAQLSADVPPPPEPEPGAPALDAGTGAAPDGGSVPPGPGSGAPEDLPSDDAGMADLAAAVDSAFTTKALELAAKADAVPHEALEDAVAQVVADMVAAACDRLTLVNVRRGTPYWDPPGEKRLDAALVVQPDRWATAAETAARPLLEQAAAAAVADVDAAAGVEGKAGPDTPPADAKAVKAAVAAGLAAVREGVQAEAARLEDLVAAQTATGAVALVAVVVLAKRLATELESAARNIGNRAGQIVRGDVADHRAGVLAKAAGLVVERKWRTRRDTAVRPTHRAVEGQVRKPGVPFDVGAAKLRYPGDPEGPPGETINCRCKLNYQRARRRARTP